MDSRIGLFNSARCPEVSYFQFGNENLVLSNELIKVELPLCKVQKADVSTVSPSFALMKG